jgi:hypothetical protein
MACLGFFDSIFSFKQGVDGDPVVELRISVSIRLPKA